MSFTSEPGDSETPAPPGDERRRTESSAGPAAVAPWPARLRLPVLAVLTLTGAVLYGLHVLHTSLWPLGWFSTTPWLLIAVHPRLQGRGNLSMFVAGVYVGALIGVKWLKAHALASWLVGPLFYVPFILVSYLVVRAVRRWRPGFPLVVLWPIAFTACEFLRLRFSPGELAVWVLGYSQIGLSRLVQVADLAGVAAVTFVLAASAGLWAEIVLALTTPSPRAAKLRRVAPQATGVAALVLACVLYGSVRDTEEHFSAGPTLHVLQADLPHSPDPDTAERVYHLHVLQTLSTARPEQTDAIIWPENSLNLHYLVRGEGMREPFASDLPDLARRLGQPVLVDGPSFAPGEELGYHTSALVEADGSLQTYDKVRLLPWTEYVPARGFFHFFGDGPRDAWLRFVKKFVGFIPKGQLGDIDALAPFELEARDGTTYRFGTPICFEVATARVVNAWNRQGIDFLINQTSEGLLGDSIHSQTITVCGFRAIEGRVSVVRAANEGISAMIDPNGRVREIVRGAVTGSSINEWGVYYPTVVIDERRGKTLYVRLGDWLSLACVGASALLLLLAWRSRSRTHADRSA